MSSSIHIFNTVGNKTFLDMLIHPLLSPFAAIFITLGICQIGSFIKNFQKESLFPPLILGVIATPLLITPIFFVAQEAQPFFLKALSLCFALFGLFYVKKIGIILLYQKNNFQFFLIPAIALWALSFFPLSDADSVAYHLALPTQILKGGEVSQYWLHAMLSGYGEFFSLLGLSIGLDNFNSILQASLFLALIPVILREIKTEEKKSFLKLFFFSLPILLFLIPNQKLQLMGIILTIFFAFRLPQAKSKWQLMELTLLASLVVGIKISFAIDFIAIALSYCLYKRNKSSLKKIASIGTIGTIGLAPLLLFKYLFFSSPVAPFHLLVSSETNQEALRGFLDMLKIYRDSPLPFPVSLLVPASPGYISTIIGLPALAILLRKPRLSYYSLLATLSFLLNFALSQHTTRFFIFPTFFAFLYFLNGSLFKKISKYIRLILLGQVTLVSFISICSVIYFSIYLFKEGGRKDYYQQFAYGYQLAEKLNKSLSPVDNFLILEKGLRIHTFLNMNYIVDDANYFFSSHFNKQLLEIPLNRDKLFYATTSEPPKNFSKVFQFKLVNQWEVQLATRNPFNRKGLERTLRLYQISSY